MNESASRLILGTWRIQQWGLEAQGVADLIAGAFDLGINTFDLADIYADFTCETQFGAALKLLPGIRKQIRLITKCGIGMVSANRPAHHTSHYNTTFTHIIASADHALKALGVEQLDGMLIHRPDPMMDADEIARAFDALKKSGKVAGFGVSNFLPHQFELLQSRLSEPLITNQVEISLLQRHALFDGTLDQCQQLRIIPQAWSPLAGGALASLNADSGVGAVVCQLSDIYQASREQIALAWLLALPSKVRPVIGTGRLERVRAMIGAESIVLDRQHWFSLLQAAQGHPIP